MFYQLSGSIQQDDIMKARIQAIANKKNAEDKEQSLQSQGEQKLVQPIPSTIKMSSIDPSVDEILFQKIWESINTNTSAKNDETPKTQKRIPISENKFKDHPNTRIGVLASSNSIVFSFIYDDIYDFGQDLANKEVLNSTYLNIHIPKSSIKEYTNRFHIRVPKENTIDKTLKSTFNLKITNNPKYKYLDKNVSHNFFLMLSNDNDYDNLSEEALDKVKFLINEVNLYLYKSSLLHLAVKQSTSFVPSKPGMNSYAVPFVPSKPGMNSSAVPFVPSKPVMNYNIYRSKYIKYKMKYLKLKEKLER